MQGKWKIRCSGSLAWAFFFIAFAVFPDSGLVQAGPGKEPDADAVMDGLQNRYQSTKDFVAEFTQETEIGSLNRTLRASGTLYFKRPAKMLWRYREPEGQFFLADGKSFYLYQPEQRQVLQSPLKEAFRSDVPLSFLWGMGNLRRDFQGTLKAAKEDHYVLELRPREGSAGSVGDLVLGVSRKHLDVVWVRMADPAGNRTTIRFSNLEREVGLKDSLFRFQPPDGADVVELPSSFFTPP